VQRQTGRRDQASGSGVNHLILVARGIKVAQQNQLDVFGLRSRAYRIERLRVLGLDREHHAPRPDRLRHQSQAREDLPGEGLHEFDVFVDERLALGAVGDHDFGLGPGLDAGGKAGAPGADHTVLPQFFGEHGETSIIRAGLPAPRSRPGADQRPGLR
jgi:hypothetical protein